ncbi:hypothetical protein ACXYMO_15155 [Arenibacterium sp. CAU 1754]
MNAMTMRPEARPMSTIWATQSRTPSASALDTETKVTLACHLNQTFSAATSWSDLVSALDARGFGLQFLNDRLILINEQNGVALCACGSLGFSFQTLAQKLGKPSVQANTGRIIPKPGAT